MAEIQNFDINETKSGKIITSGPGKKQHFFRITNLEIAFFCA